MDFRLFKTFMIAIGYVITTGFSASSASAAAKNVFRAKRRPDTLYKMKPLNQATVQALFDRLHTHKPTAAAHPTKPKKQENTEDIADAIRNGAGRQMKPRYHAPEVIIIENKDEKVETKDEKVESTIYQCNSIDQTTYESSPFNLSGDYNLCGLFATFNGLKMLQLAQENKKLQKDMPAQSYDSFNLWYTKNIHVLAHLKKRYGTIGDCKMFALEILLAQGAAEKFSDDTIKKMLIDNSSIPSTENISVIEMAWLKENKLDRHAFTNIKTFRETGAPQLIILLIDLPSLGRHWISMVITPHQTWIMDSFKNLNRTTLAEVHIINTLFRYRDLTSFAPKNRRKKTTVLVTPALSTDLVANPTEAGLIPLVIAETPKARDAVVVLDHDSRHPHKVARTCIDHGHTEDFGIPAPYIPPRIQYEEQSDHHITASEGKFPRKKSCTQRALQIIGNTIRKSTGFAAGACRLFAAHTARLYLQHCLSTPPTPTEINCAGIW